VRAVRREKLRGLDELLRGAVRSGKNGSPRSWLPVGPLLAGS
jgi:hypothetical protein